MAFNHGHGKDRRAGTYQPKIHADYEDDQNHVCISKYTNRCEICGSKLPKSQLDERN